MRDFESIGRVLGRPARLLNLAGLIVLAAGVLTGAALHATGANRAVSIAVAVAIISLGIGLLWLRFLGSRVAPAYEAILHHDLIERAAWRRATGSQRPRSRSRAAGWLRRHPEPPDPTSGDLIRRAELLMWTGHRDEASLLLRRVRPETPLDRFDLLVDLATIDAIEDRKVDLQPIREALLAIDEQAERRVRRVCLGLLESRIALGKGEDPWLPVLSARADLDGVAPAATLRAVTAAVFALVVVLTGLAAAVLTVVPR
jgi:hypothetical protein